MNSTLGPPRIAPRNDATSPLGLSTTFRDFQNANDAAPPTEAFDDASEESTVCKYCDGDGYFIENVNVRFALNFDIIKVFAAVI